MRAELWSSREFAWEPVGTPREYLDANLRPPRLRHLDADALARAHGVRFERECVIGSGAAIEPGASLRRVVIWDGERVPADARGANGVFAGGAFHSCEDAGGRSA